MTFQKNYNLQAVKAGRQNERGISVLLAILILSSLTIVTIAISDVILRVGRSSRQIGQSEIAYFAAETAVEKALYYIEKGEPRTIIIPDGGSGSLSDIVGANWSRTVFEVINVLVDCDDLSGEGICLTQPSVDDIISTSNPLIVKLNEGHSFQIDLDFIGLSSLDNNLQITATVGNGQVIYSGDDGQAGPFDLPQMVNNVSTKHYIIRLINTFVGSSEFELKPTGGGGLPVGILVTGAGTYQNEQRVLKVERKNWQIY